MLNDKIWINYNEVKLILFISMKKYQLRLIWKIFFGFCFRIWSICKNNFEKNYFLLEYWGNFLMILSYCQIVFTDTNHIDFPRRLKNFLIKISNTSILSRSFISLKPNLLWLHHTHHVILLQISSLILLLKFRSTKNSQKSS